MSVALENAKKFLEQAMKDEALRARVSEKEPGEVAAIAGELGFEVTAAELTQAELALRLAPANREKSVELNVNDLAQVAGGMFWDGDDAPDGHEMGCFITYHQWWTCEENKWWCHNYYYGEHGEIINR
jgi:predicted ribosomally synthesized peptide with nif11-like leader